MTQFWIPHGSEYASRLYPLQFSVEPLIDQEFKWTKEDMRVESGDKVELRPGRIYFDVRGSEKINQDVATLKKTKTNI